MRTLITGATGFVGTALVDRMVKENRYTVRVALRRDLSDLAPNIEQAKADLGVETDWQQGLAGVDIVVHLAARVHMMRETTADPLREFRRVNVAGTLNLARQAATAGLKRFVYLSSVKVHGESGTYTEMDSPAPVDAYGLSKLEAERGLLKIAADTAMDVVIIRAPLVYGRNVRANFGALMRIVSLGVPLPFASVDNRRSLVGLDNLVDFILTCIEHPAAANEIFLVCDGENLSTADLVRRLARAMDRPARLIPVPPSLLLGAASMIGRRAVAHRLLESLCVDITKAQQLLEWTPPVSVDEGLRLAVDGRV